MYLKKLSKTIITSRGKNEKRTFTAFRDLNFSISV